MRAALVRVSVSLLVFTGACVDSGGDTFGHVPVPDPGHLTICNMADPETLDPAYTTSATDLKVLYELFDGLTSFDPDGMPLPSIASSWETTPDRRRTTFHLRESARWSNGLARRASSSAPAPIS